MEELINKNVLKFSFANMVKENLNKLMAEVVSCNEMNTLENKLTTILMKSRGIDEFSL